MRLQELPAMELPAPNSLTAIHWTLAWGVLVVAPAALAASRPPSTKISNFLRLAGLLMVLGAIWPKSFLMPSALSWLAASLVLSAWGFWRLGQRAYFCPAETLLDLGFLYAPVSGIWTLAFATGGGLMGFDPTMTLLTGVHFCYVTLGAMPWAAQLGRRLLSSSTSFRLLTLGYAAGPALVAAGITSSHWSERTTGLEVAGVSLQVLSTTGMTVLALLRLRLHPLLLISGGCSLLTMALALNYVWGRWLGFPHLDLSTMIPYHGLVNALGFVTLGHWGWSLQPAPPCSPSYELPFQHVGGGWPIGPNYFERHFALGEPPSGLLDDVSQLDSSDFRARLVLPSIHSFYVKTANHEMQVTAHWPPLWGAWAYLYGHLSRAIGQMNFPLGSEQAAVQSQMLGLPEGARGWVRSYRDSGQAIYCASYTMFRLQDRGYMNVAFPLPLGNLTSLLWARNLPEGGLVLSSFSAAHRPAGVFWVFRGRGWRLPINEEIEVYEQDGELRAQHRTWMLGLRCLTLHYVVTPQ